MKKIVSLICIFIMFMSAFLPTVVYGAELTAEEQAQLNEYEALIEEERSSYGGFWEEEEILGTEKYKDYQLLIKKKRANVDNDETAYNQAVDSLKSLSAAQLSAMSDEEFKQKCDDIIAKSLEPSDGSGNLPSKNKAGDYDIRQRYSNIYYKELNESQQAINNNKNNSGDFWGQATNWWNKGQTDSNKFQLPEQAKSIIDMFSDMINVVGTTLIIIATIVLGIKFIFGSVESQTGAKEGLITLLVACIFFFGWQGIYGLLVDSGSNQLVFTSGTTSYKSAIGNVLYVVSFVAKCLLVIGVIYVGIKYIFAGAAGKAQLKGKSVYFFIGIILAFATTNVLSFISKIVNEVV